jgi:hypothetical protein
MIKTPVMVMILMDLQNDLSYGFKRAKMSWYTFGLYFALKPDGISNDDLSLNATRRIFNCIMLWQLRTKDGPKWRKYTRFNLLSPYEGRTIAITNYSREIMEESRGVIKFYNFEQGKRRIYINVVLDPFVGNGKTAQIT